MSGKVGSQFTNSGVIGSPVLGEPASGVMTNLTGTLTSPTFVTPALGTPASGVSTNLTALDTTELSAGVLPTDITGGAGLTALGTVASGTLGSAVALNHNALKHSWHRMAGASVDQSSAGCLDFTTSIFLGSRCTESAGVITVLDAGIYWISCTIGANGYAIRAIDFSLRVNSGSINGSRIYTDASFSDAAAVRYPNVAGSWAVDLDADDTVCMYGSGYYYGAGADSMTWFSGTRIGAKS